MTRPFVDLHLRLNPKDQQAAQHIFVKAAKLGYAQISVPSSPLPNHEDQVAQLKNLGSQTNLDFVSRIDFRPRNQEDLTRFLRKYRRKYEIICIQCDNKETARQAAKDRRVDLLNFPNLDYYKRFFDKAEAELSSNCQTALEIDIKPLLVLEGPPRTRLLSTLQREASLALRFHVPIIISSGISEEKFLRKPRDLASLGLLFGLGEAESLDSVSTNPSTIVARNREKLNPAFIAPGIKLIKEGRQA
jgi:RNase P/RNase MRP subunit p30